MKKTVLVNLSFLFLLIFSGCAPMVQTARVVNIPELNKVSKVEVGENMYEKIFAIYSHDKDIILIDPINIQKMNVSFASGTKIEQEPSSSNQFVGYANGYNFVDKNNSGYFTEASTDLIPLVKTTFQLDKPVKYETVEAKPDSYTDESYKKVALYQGKVDNKIKISYREFTHMYSPYFQGDIARPAFTQDIEYELQSDGTAIIGFKGLRIQVIKATNLDIEYKVLQEYK